MQGMLDRLRAGWELAREPQGLRAVEAREERAFAGNVSGVLYLMTGLAALIFLTVPGTEPGHPVAVGALGGVALVLGAASLLLADWERAAGRLAHLSTIAQLATVFGLMASTGGMTSPFRFYLTFVVVFATYFFPAREAVGYMLCCGLVATSPLLYGDVTDDELRELALLVPTSILLAIALMAGRHVRLRLTRRATALADEQAALRRVATAVAAGSPPSAVFTLVASEVLRLVPGAQVSGVVKFDHADSAQLMGVWRLHDQRVLEPGTRLPLHPGGELATVRLTGRPLRIDDHERERGGLAARMGYAASVLAPVHVHGRLWGALGVASNRSDCWDRMTEQRLADFADLLTTAIADTEDRARLAAQEGLDTLTGLPNHRTLQERLTDEVSRAVRHGRPLTLAIVDVDHFKEVNRRLGHENGDKVLLEVAARLTTVIRAEDVLARVGGDEFALLLPESDRHTAYAVLERARRLVASEPFAHSARLTISAGICDVEIAEDPESMYRLADGALYWSKVQGRDVTWIYDPEVVRELSAHERAEQLARSQALLGLRALARAIDAKDPSTRQHSERVATLASHLADAAGWPRRRAAELHEAALVHDVGKIGIPDAVLLKPGRLNRDEYALVQEHAELGARIVSEVLAPEQVRWVRAHHERPDGRGYPDGLDAARIPDGGALLAMADCWDVMTSARSYSAPMPVEEAMAECRTLAGAQFTAEAVAALEVLYARGVLGEPLSETFASAA